jgi:hypothetical protein
MYGIIAAYRAQWPPIINFIERNGGRPAGEEIGERITGEAVKKSNA